MWLLQSPVNPKSCGTFSWPSSKSPFSPFFLAKSLLLPKPRGKKKHSKTSWSSLLSFRTAWSFSPFQNLVVLLFYFRTTWTFIYLLASEPRGSTLSFRAAWSPPHLLLSRVVSSFSPKTLWSSLLLWSRVVSSSFSPKTLWSSPLFEAAWSLLTMAAGPRFKSQCPSSFAAPFLTPPTVSYTCQHPRILPALLGCHSKSGQVWPHGMEPIISKLSRRPCNQGELLPSPILGGIWSHPPGSKHGHSYLTHP